MSVRLDAEKTKKYVTDIFKTVGLSENDAETVADNLLAAELRHVKSHGLVQVRNYTELYEKGIFNKNPDIRKIKESPVTVLYDADRGPGAVAGKIAMEDVIRKAETSGVAAGSVRNGTHFGMAAYYAREAVKKGLIGFAFTNAGQIVAPYGGLRKELGTNPICVAVPAAGHKPLIFDAATSVEAFNKIFFAYTEHRKIPADWSIDRKGRATEDPADVIERDGALLPFGGYKGYGLAVVVNILTGLLSGASLEKDEQGKIRENPRPVGYFFAALNPDFFVGRTELAELTGLFIDRLHNSEAVNPDKPVLVPGEIEDNWEADGRANGIEVFDGVRHDLDETGKRLGLPETTEDLIFRKKADGNA